MISTESLLEDLTPPQREAVAYVDGPLLVIAGAGSGKTRVLTRRVGYLASVGIPVSSIVAITFTNKAAGEMKERVGALLPGSIRDFGKLDQPGPMVCTFHSLCLRILKAYAAKVGLDPRFQVYDSSDQTKLLKEAMAALELSKDNFPLAGIAAAISTAKNQLVGPEEFASGASDYYQKAVARAYAKYQKLLTAAGAVDFDDLLFKTAIALRDVPAILGELQDRFNYFMIDEYQDTNRAQYILAHALASRGQNIAVVGDPDQSIYAWRGADIRNILEFEKDYPNAKVIPLEQNYRSTQNILAVASGLIAQNQQRKKKSLWTQNPAGEKARLFLCADEHAEAITIAGELQRLHDKEEIPYSGMAIFYRMNWLSRVMEGALRQLAIPYQIARGVEFYNRKEIKDVLAYLRVIHNPNDPVSLARVLNVPTRGIGDAAQKQLEAASVERSMSMWDVLRSAGEISTLSAKAKSGIGQFVGLIESLRAGAVDGRIFPVRALVDKVVQKSGLDAVFKKEDPDKTEQVANVNELITSAAEYDRDNPEGSLDDYLSRVSLVSDVDHLDPGGGSVTLMTLHAAKGLEFPVVAILGLEDGILPHERGLTDPDQMEEERRLCFVGITRAEQRLLLSRAASRMVRGETKRAITSRFVYEMPADRLDVIELSDDRGDSFSPRMSSSGSAWTGRAKPREFSVGQRVHSATFGLGTVADVSDSGSGERVEVVFDKSGRKRLIAEHAHLEVVEDDQRSNRRARRSP